MISGYSPQDTKSVQPSVYVAGLYQDLEGVPNNRRPHKEGIATSCLRQESEVNSQKSLLSKIIQFHDSALRNHSVLDG